MLLTMPTLYYVYDPMCSWCYALASVWKRIVAGLPASIAVEYVAGGLARDSDEPMPQEMRAGIEATWRRIQAVVPGTEFNFDFWTNCEPRRSTYPACRAVLAVRHFDPTREYAMIENIQSAYYREARNPSDVDTLVALAIDLGIDADAYRALLLSEDCEQLLQESFQTRRDLGVRAFPTLVLASGGSQIVIPYDFSDPQVVLDALTVDAVGKAHHEGR
ncbi:MAG: DsbA family protein [Candidatus Rariloculaceae bacterium]